MRARANHSSVCVHDVEMKDNLWTGEEKKPGKKFLHTMQFNQRATKSK